MIELSSGWSIFGILGVVCALIYRIPQAAKLYETKKSDDVSMKSFTVQTFAYGFFVLYMFKYFDAILFFYYISGGLQNIFVLYLIKKYRNNDTDLGNCITDQSIEMSKGQQIKNSNDYIGEGVQENLNEFTDITI